MRRLIPIALLILIVASACIADRVPQPGSAEVFWTSKAQSNGMPDGVPEVLQMRARLLGDLTSALRWPDKKVNLDVKDTSIRRIAEMLNTQTGITFAVKDAVPGSLKITIQVGGMGVKQFLDTFCGATNLTYVAESRVEPDAKSSEPEKTENKPVTSGERVTIGAPEISLLPSGEGFEMVAPGGQKIVMLNAGLGKPVTHVTISSLAAEGVVVNMGTVSLSVKNADPVEVATKLIKQINGASYMMMELKDYLSLQDADRAEEIEKAVKKTPRVKVTLTLRNVPIREALQKLAEKGNIYVATPQPGSNFLIIPDVQVLDKKVLPGMDYAPITLRDLETTWDMIPKLPVPPKVPKKD